MSVESSKTGEGASAPRSATDALAEDVRRQVLSGTRIKVAFTVVTLVLLAALSAMMAVSVGRIFDWLTPVARKDLYWKTQRGVAELGRTADLGILLGDRALIEQTAKDYLADPEVMLLAVYDAQGKLLYEHNKGGVAVSAPFLGPPRAVHQNRALLWAWSDVQVEGQRVGKLGLAVSTERLRAGESLRAEILRTALGACLLAVVLSLMFVHLYVGPLITVTKRAFLELERKTVEAMESTRVKSEFLANMSHEIRTPLNGIIGMIGLLMRGELSAQQRRRAEISETSARSLLALINDVLDFSKMEAGHHVLNATDCEVHQLVQNRVELLAVKAHAKQLEIAYRIADDVPPVVRADSDRVTQVLTNLLSNAVKFTEQGEVLVAVTSEKSAQLRPDELMLRFEVRDTGPGIDPQHHDRLFRSFSQVDTSSTRAHEGTGLGLAISKHLVQLMGGEIGLTSALGRGSTFWFTIRCTPVQREQDLRKTVGSPLGRRILIVDSNEMYRDTLVEYAKRWGMLATAAASAEQALAHAREATEQGSPFEFAVIDQKLHGAGGAPLAEALKQQCGAQLSLIQLTPALWTPADGQGGAEGMFLTKPVRASELYDCIVSRSTDGARVEGQRRGLKMGNRRGHILVVDDNEVNRVLADELLRELGHSCDLAAGGKEAIDQASARVYDAILMDCQMPGINGYQATHEIREFELRHARRTPIIALTAHAFTGEEQKVRAAGMDDFLTKPVAPRALDATLQKWMAVAATGRIRSIPDFEMTDDSQIVAIQAVTPANDAQPEDPADGKPVLKEQRRSPRLIEAFLRNVPEQVAGLVQASAGEELSLIRERAHKLKGSSVSVGAMRMAALCEAMQGAAERGERAPLAAWAGRVAEELTQVRAQLDAELGAKRSKPA